MSRRRCSRVPLPGTASSERWAASSKTPSWDQLSGTTSAPFTKGGNDEVAVEVIDDRGNELVVVKKLAEASDG